MQKFSQATHQPNHHFLTAAWLDATILYPSNFTHSLNSPNLKFNCRIDTLTVTYILLAFVFSSLIFHFYFVNLERSIRIKKLKCPLLSTKSR